MEGLDLRLVAFITASLAIIIVPGVDFALVTRQVVRHGRRAGFVTLGGLVVGGLVHASLATAGLSALLVSSPRWYAVLRALGAAYLVYLGAIMLWATRPPAQAAAARAASGMREPNPRQPETREPEPDLREPDPREWAAGRVAGRGAARDGRPGGRAAAATAPRRMETSTVDVPPDQAPRVHRRAFALGITSNLLNPKVVLFYVTFLPQFVTPGAHAASRTAFLAGLFITMAVAWWIVYILLIDSLQSWLRRPAVRIAIERLTAVALLTLGVALALGH